MGGTARPVTAPAGDSRAGSERFHRPRRTGRARAGLRGGARERRRTPSSGPLVGRGVRRRRGGAVWAGGRLEERPVDVEPAGHAERHGHGHVLQRQPPPHAGRRCCRAHGHAWGGRARTAARPRLGFGPRPRCPHLNAGYSRAPASRWLQAPDGSTGAVPPPAVAHALAGQAAGQLRARMPEAVRLRKRRSVLYSSAGGAAAQRGAGKRGWVGPGRAGRGRGRGRAGGRPPRGP